MKKAIIGVGLLVCGTLGVSTQRIIDTIFVANGWELTHSGMNLLYLLSSLAIIAGIVLCIWSLKEKDR